MDIWSLCIVIDEFLRRKKKRLVNHNLQLLRFFFSLFRIIAAPAVFFFVFFVAVLTPWGEILLSRSPSPRLSKITGSTAWIASSELRAIISRTLPWQTSKCARSRISSLFFSLFFSVSHEKSMWTNIWAQVSQVLSPTWSCMFGDECYFPAASHPEGSSVYCCHEQ